MTDPAISNLAGDYVTISVTITNHAQSLLELVKAELDTLGLKGPQVLQMSVLPNQPGVATDRSAILYGGAGAQLGYLPAGHERVFPVIMGEVYVKRVSAPNVSATIECFLRKVP